MLPFPPHLTITLIRLQYNRMGFPSGSVGKVSACNAGDPDSIPRLGRSSGERNGNLLWCSCLENSMDSLAGYSSWDCTEWHDWAINTLVIMCDAAMNTSIQISSQVPTLNLLGIYLEVEFLDHRWSQCLVFWGSAIILSSVAAPFYISTNNAQVFQFLHILDNSCCFIFLFS